MYLYAFVSSVKNLKFNWTSHNSRIQGNMAAMYLTYQNLVKQSISIHL